MLTMVFPKFQFPLSVDDQVRLFPNALPVTGTLHLLDGVLKWVLFKAKFFPGFLLKLKGVVSFIKHVGHKDCIIRNLQASMNP